MDKLWELFCKTGLPEVYLLYKEQHNGDTHKRDRHPRDGGGGE